MGTSRDDLVICACSLLVTSEREWLCLFLGEARSNFQLFERVLVVRLEELGDDHPIDTVLLGGARASSDST